MTAWLRRFGLHLTAAIGATGIFVAAAVVGASESRQRAEIVASAVTPQRVISASPGPARRQPSPSASPSPNAAGSADAPARQPAAAASPSPQAAPTRTPSPTAVTRVNPERSISGTISNVSGDGLQVEMKNGKTVRVTPFPGALIRLNGKTVKLNDLKPGDTVVVLGQQVSTTSPNTPRFEAHAITARRT